MTMTELRLECGAETTELMKEPSGGNFCLPCLPLPFLSAGTAGPLDWATINDHDHDHGARRRRSRLMQWCCSAVAFCVPRIIESTYCRMSHSTLTLTLTHSSLLLTGRALQSCVRSLHPSSPSPWLGELHYSTSMARQALSKKRRSINQSSRPLLNLKRTKKEAP